MIRQRKSSRPAVAAIELALVTAGILIPLMFGVWEIGRMIQVKQIMANSAREGARLASQGYTINTAGTPTQVFATSAGGPINVSDTVFRYLSSMGLTRLVASDVTTTFTFTSTNGATDPVTGNPTTNTASPQTDPYVGIKGQPFSVKVTVPWAKVRWVNAGLINPTNLTVTVQWEMLRDDVFTVNTSLPTW